MSDNKRKNSSKQEERPAKKQQTASSVRVKHVLGSDVLKPVIAIFPAARPPDITFQSYSKIAGRKTNLLLHSSEHISLDYTARDDDNSIEGNLKHYVAVYDETTRKLQVTEARKLTVRSSLRLSTQSQINGADVNVLVANPSSRAALTQEFGTKKSKRAAQSSNQNRLLAQGADGVDDQISTAMLSNVKEEEANVNDISLLDALNNKPLPTADLGTNEIDRVYPLDTLIHPSPADSTLEAMPINTWMARIAAKKEVKARHRFVVNRVGYLVRHSPDASNPKIALALKVLRFIQLLLEIHTYVTRLPKRRTIPPTDKWPDKTVSTDTPMSLLRPLMSRFFPDRLPKDHHITLLRTTILALAFHIPPPSLNSGENRLVTEPTDISLDMAIEANEVKKLYRELGCHVGPATEAELTLWQMEKLGKKKKDEAGNMLPKPVFAKLELPLSFPKLSRGRPTARR